MAGNGSLPRVFTESISEENTIAGEDALHLVSALRLRPGEELILCCEEVDYCCEVVGVEKGGRGGKGCSLSCKVRSQCPSAGEPKGEVTLYQGIPKGEKLEFILQKAVELGVSRIVPLETSRTVARYRDAGEFEGKLLRLRRIAKEAASQSGRGRIPAVESWMTLEEALLDMESRGARGLFCYEGGGMGFAEALKSESLISPLKLGLIVGSEGGFSPEEAEFLKDSGVTAVTLGRRILRCETAPLAALTLIMHILGEL